MQNTSTLALDCRCTLVEVLVGSQNLQSVLWTDIEKSKLWMYRPHDGMARQWSLPDRLGCFAVCRSGRLLLGLAKSLAFAEIDFDGDSPLRIAPVMPIEPGGTRTRINDGRTDRAGSFVFGTYNEAQDAASGSFYQYSSRFGLRRLDLGGVVIPNSICFSLDGRTMYFCDSPTGLIRQCDYDADSAGVANISSFVQCRDDGGFPDGSVVDREGHLWNAVWGTGVVRRFTPEGRLAEEIAVPSRNLTCPAFGGAALDQLFVTSSRQEMTEDELNRVPTSGGLFLIHPDVTGIPDALFSDR